MTLNLSYCSQWLVEMTCQPIYVLAACDMRQQGVTACDEAGNEAERLPVSFS